DERVDLPDSTVAKVAQVPGVDVAVGRVSTASILSVSRIIDSKGKALGGAQGSTELESWLGSSAVSPYRVIAGHGPATTKEMVLNVGAAEDGHLSIGDRVTVITQDGPAVYKLVGTFGLGSAN